MEVDFQLRKGTYIVTCIVYGSDSVYLIRP
jgi:hypothetical protein